MSTSKLFGKDILITSTAEAISNTNTLGNILIHTQPFIRIKVSFNFCH